jgi:hypothetical protein
MDLTYVKYIFTLWRMIDSFRHKGVRRFYEHDDRRHPPLEP